MPELAAAAAVHRTCAALLARGSWREWLLSYFQDLVAALCGVPSVRGDGDLEAMAAYENVVLEVEDLVRANGQLAEFFDPLFSLFFSP